MSFSLKDDRQEQDEGVEVQREGQGARSMARGGRECAVLRRNSEGPVVLECGGREGEKHGATPVRETGAASYRVLWPQYRMGFAFLLREWKPLKMKLKEICW